MAMAGKGIGILVVVGIVAAAALYARRAQAAYMDDTGQTSWLPDLSLPDLSLPDFSFDTWGASPDNEPAQTLPGGETVYWKVNEYPKYASAIRDAEISNGIPQDLLARVLYQESRYRVDVITGANRSPVGATGIAQFMPDAAKDMGLIGPGYDNRTNPFAAIPAAARYLRLMYNQFQNWPDALAAYNWGPGNVRNWKRAQGAYPQPMETSTYVAQITADVPVA